MTVIAGYVDREGGRVHLAADSASVAGDGLVLPKAKIHGLVLGDDDHAIFGAAGMAALAPLAQRHLDTEALPTDAGPDAWAQELAEGITRIALDHLLINTEDDDGRADFAILLAWQDRLWALSHDVAVPVEHYHSVGHGAAVAMGAMWACDQNVPDPAEIPRLAVEAAIAHMDGISGPVTTASTEGD